MQSFTGKVKGEGQRKGIPYHDDSNTEITKHTRQGATLPEILRQNNFSHSPQFN